MPQSIANKALLTLIRRLNTAHTDPAKLQLCRAAINALEKCPFKLDEKEDVLGLNTGAFGAPVKPDVICSPAEAASDPAGPGQLWVKLEGADELQLYSHTFLWTEAEALWDQLGSYDDKKRPREEVDGGAPQQNDNSQSGAAAAKSPAGPPYPKPGRAPNGKKWDPMTGDWVDKPEKKTADSQAAPHGDGGGSSGGAWSVPAAAAPQEANEGAKKKAKKAYRPEYRTAGWGLVIALHQAGAWGSNDNFMLRAALIEKAQPMCNAPLETGPIGKGGGKGGGSFQPQYGGWSIMNKQLIEKNAYVKKWSNPAKYQLTEAGLECAKDIIDRLEKSNLDEYGGVRGTGASQVAPQPQASQPKASQPQASQPKASQPQASQPQASQPQASQPQASQGDEDVQLTPGMVVTLCGIGKLEYQGLNGRPGKISKFDTKQQRWVVALDAEFEDTAGQRLKKVSMKPANIRVTAIDSLMQVLPQRSRSEVAAALNRCGGDEANALDALLKVDSDDGSGGETAGTATEPDSKEGSSLAAAWGGETAGPSSRPAVPGQGEYEVVLVVDSRERGKGKEKESANIWSDKLTRAGVSHVVRILPVGDFVWIGRHRHLPDEERLLDHCMERKEVSDLASSIISKRYEEQKFHMRECGLSRLHYLLEGNPEALEGSLNGASLLKALHDTYCEGFGTIRTKNQFETITTLKEWTYHLKSIHEADTGGVWRQRPRYDSWVEKAKSDRQMTVGLVWERMVNAVPRLGRDGSQAFSREFPTAATAYEASVRPGDGVDRMMRQVQENHSLNNRQWGSAIRDRFTKLLTTKPDPAC